jgi:hypothetical protein
MELEHNQNWDINGNLIFEEFLEIKQKPLDKIEVLATLLVVVGVLDIGDAGNAVGVTPEHLIAEAEAWAASMEAYNGD